MHLYAQAEKSADSEKARIIGGSLTVWAVDVACGVLEDKGPQPPSKTVQRAVRCT